MTIKEVTKATIFYVETNEEYYNRYIRHGENSWTVAIGESDEPVYDCEELESLFQKWMLENKVLK